MNNKAIFLGKHNADCEAAEKVQSGKWNRCWVSPVEIQFLEYDRIGRRHPNAATPYAVFSCIISACRARLALPIAEIWDALDEVGVGPIEDEH